MLLTNHVLTGAALALAIKEPVLAAPAAFVSHFVLDSVPHFGFKGASFKSPKGFALGFVDASVSLGVYIYIITQYPQHFWLLTVGMFFAALPDLFYVPDILFNKRFDPKVMQRFHSWVQKELPRGAMVEAIWLYVITTLLHDLLS